MLLKPLRSFAIFKLPYDYRESGIARAPNFTQGRAPLFTSV
jgi:hypothetical protein